MNTYSSSNEMLHSDSDISVEQERFGKGVLYLHRDGVLNF